jgi:hypothetical protein
LEGTINENDGNVTADVFGGEAVALPTDSGSDLI